MRLGLCSNSAAGAALCDLIVKEADNNVKLIVLDRFNTLREKHPHVLDNSTMDILKVLSRCVWADSGRNGEVD